MYFATHQYAKASICKMYIITQKGKTFLRNIGFLREITTAINV